MAAHGAETPHPQENEDLFDFPVVEIEREPSAETPPPVTVAVPAISASTPAPHAPIVVPSEAPALLPLHASARPAPVIAAAHSPHAATSAASNAPTQHALEQESEDLFDFPLVEIPLAEAMSAVHLAAIVPSAPTPAPRAAAPSILSVMAPASVAAATAPRAASVSAATAPLAVVEKSSGSASATTAPPALASATDEKPLDDEIRPHGRKRARLAGARPLWIALAIIALGNLTGLWFLWQSHSSVGAGIEVLREELDTTARRIERERREAASKERREAATTLDPASAPVGSIERASVEIALQQLNSGEYAAARVRLQRLLAQADRMERSVRDELEPRIVYLVAQSYYDEARVRRGAVQ